MYNNKIHLFTGRTEIPDEEHLTDAVNGAIAGYVVGSTLCYSYENYPQEARPQYMEFRGGGPEKLNPGEMDKLTIKGLKVIDRLTVGLSGGFGERMADFFTRGISYSDQAEKSLEEMVLYREINTDQVLPFVLGPVIMGLPQKAMTVSRLLQNHPVTDAVVWDYVTVMKSAILDRKIRINQNLYGGIPTRMMEPNGHITNTFNNAVVMVESGLSFDGIMSVICGHGGHCTIIGGVAGSLWGAINGQQVPHYHELLGYELVDRLAKAVVNHIKAS